MARCGGVIEIRPRGRPGPDRESGGALRAADRWLRHVGVRYPYDDPAARRSGVGQDRHASEVRPRRVRSRPGFVGLSIEFRTLDNYAGTNPNAINPVFVQLMKNLAPGQAGQLRIGGDTTDWTWYPYGSRKAPSGVRYAITQPLARRRPRARRGARRQDDHRDQPRGQQHAPRLRRGARVCARHRLGPDRGLEIGNEPELYGSFAWYVLHGVKHFGRPHSYDFDDFLHDYAATARAMPARAARGTEHRRPALDADPRSVPQHRARHQGRDAPPLSAQGAARSPRT